MIGGKVTAALAGIALAVGVTVVAGASPAAAADICPYPYVCFYPTWTEYSHGTPTSRYQDVTSGWQYLRSKSIGADYVYNTRHDDVAYLHFTNGKVQCMVPQNVLYEPDLVVDRVRIDSASTC